MVSSRRILSLFLLMLIPLLLCPCLEQQEYGSTGTQNRTVPRAVWVESETEAKADRDGEAVRLVTAAGVRTLTMEDYLLGVVGAEMPASFSMEALKAQAVAARTDTLYRRLTGIHADGDCCDNAACCKAYLDEEQLRERWGADYDCWAARIRLAVEETNGEVLLWEGKPIFAAFHAASDGYTEDCENVWVQALPYLRSVSSPEDGSRIPGFTRSVTVTRAELSSLVSGAAPGIRAENWLTEPMYTFSGRLKQISAGGVTLSGTALRLKLGLGSSKISWTAEGEQLTLTSAGIGHGVGMSQYGAEAMAQFGADYREILHHYYTGVSLQVYAG